MKIQVQDPDGEVRTREVSGFLIPGDAYGALIDLIKSLPYRQADPMLGLLEKNSQPQFIPTKGENGGGGIITPKKDLIVPAGAKRPDVEKPGKEGA